MATCAEAPAAEVPGFFRFEAGKSGFSSLLISFRVSKSVIRCMRSQHLTMFDGESVFASVSECTHRLHFICVLDQSWPSIRDKKGIHVDTDKSQGVCMLGHTIFPWNRIQLSETSTRVSVLIYDCARESRVKEASSYFRK